MACERIHSTSDPQPPPQRQLFLRAGMLKMPRTPSTAIHKAIACFTSGTCQVLSTRPGKPVPPNCMYVLWELWDLRGRRV